jgi:homoserine kinase
VEVESNIPVGKGLGSSAAAAVAALSIVAASKGDEFDYDDVLRQAADIEGHPDNAAPAIVGGLVAVVGDYDNPRVLQLPLSPDIGFVYAAPDVEISTKAARKALPELIPHDAAARTIARTVALVEGLAEAEPELLRIGFNDELHVPFRLAMIPGGTHALDAALRAGAWAATISGSGSGVIAACERGDEKRVLAAMIDGFESATEESASGFVAEPDFDGVRVERLG